MSERLTYAELLERNTKLEEEAVMLRHAIAQAQVLIAEKNRKIILLTSIKPRSVAPLDPKADDMFKRPYR